MKKFAIAIVAFFGLAAAVQAADVSGKMLSKMGLAGMQRLTDAQGMAIRGMGDDINQNISVGDDQNNNNTVNQTNTGGAAVQQSNVLQGSNNVGDIENSAEDIDQDVDNDDSFNKYVIKKSSKKHGKKRRGHRGGHGGHGGHGGGYGD
jgi:hypothetical protein